MNRLAQLALVSLAVALPACAPTAHAPAAKDAQMARVSAPCDALLPVREGDASWTVEGFEGGGETQLFITKRQPVKRCSPAVVQNRRATLDALH